MSGSDNCALCLLCLLPAALQKGKKGGAKKGKGEGEEGVELTPEEREARAKLRYFVSAPSHVAHVSRLRVDWHPSLAYKKHARSYTISRIVLVSSSKSASCCKNCRTAAAVCEFELTRRATESRRSNESLFNDKMSSTARFRRTMTCARNNPSSSRTSRYLALFQKIDIPVEFMVHERGYTKK